MKLGSHRHERLGILTKSATINFAQATPASRSAMLSNALQDIVCLFGYPVVPLARMLDWTADWVAADRRSLNKPTKFEVRSGAY